MAGLSLSIFRACPTRHGQAHYSGIISIESSGHLLRTGRNRLFRDVGWDTSARCFLFVYNLGCVLGALIAPMLRRRWAWASRGNLRQETLRALSQAGGLGRTVVSHSCTPSNQILGSSLACAAGAGRAPTPWSGTPFFLGSSRLGGTYRDGADGATVVRWRWEATAFLRGEWPAPYCGSPCNDAVGVTSQQ